MSGFVQFARLNAAAVAPHPDRHCESSCPPGSERLAEAAAPVWEAGPSGSIGAEFAGMWGLNLCHELVISATCACAVP